MRLPTITSLVVVVLVGFLIWQSGAATAQEAAPAKAKEDQLAALVRGNNAFALDLYKQLGKKEGNLFFSPYSISTALGMTYAGARGNTAKEMAQTLAPYPGQPAPASRVWRAYP